MPNLTSPAWLGFKLVKIVKVDIFFQAQFECVVNINNCNNRLIFLSLVFHLHYSCKYIIPACCNNIILLSSCRVSYITAFIAQWQSAGLVNQRPRVQSSLEAFLPMINLFKFCPISNMYKINK